MASDETAHVKHRFPKRLVMALLLFYGLFLVLDVWTHRDKYLWDYRGCYYNGWDYREGILPYARTLMRQPLHAPTKVYNFLYHPILLWLFAGL